MAQAATGGRPTAGCAGGASPDRLRPLGPLVAAGDPPPVGVGATRASKPKRVVNGSQSPGQSVGRRWAAPLWSADQVIISRVRGRQAGASGGVHQITERQQPIKPPACSGTSARAPLTADEAFSVVVPRCHVVGPGQRRRSARLQNGEAKAPLTFLALLTPARQRSADPRPVPAGVTALLMFSQR